MCPEYTVLKTYNENKDLTPKCVFPPQTTKPATGLVETRWLNAVVQLRFKIYSRCRCDDTDNVAPRDIETSNRSAEFNDATIIIMLCKKWAKEFVEDKRKVWWAVPPNAPRRNGPECAAAFDYIQSIKSGVTKGLIQGPTSQHSETNLRNDGEPDLDCYTKTLNHRKVLRKKQKNNLLKTERILKPKCSRIRL